jgi:glycerophosphoryl diester phosphodiesterase
VETLPERGISAHRGGAARHPENTLAAFREAVRLGAHQIELDVRRTADGEAVVIHDETVDRTTDGRGRVDRLTLAELRRLDAGRWKGERFAGERVPTLREVLEIMPRDLWLNLQIKRAEPVAREVAALIAAQDRLHQTIVACGNAAGVAARELHPEILLCNLARKRTRAAYLEHAVAMGSNFVQFHHLRGAPEPELVERARAAGLRVNHCCDPELCDLEAIFAAGVDFALVDDLPRGLEQARRLGMPPLRRN